jgi:hypothetical protein
LKKSENYIYFSSPRFSFASKALINRCRKCLKVAKKAPKLPKKRLLKKGLHVF